MAAVVPDLKSAILNRFDEMQILGPANFAEDDIAGSKIARTDRLDGAKLTGFDARRHRVATRPKGNCATSAKIRNVSSGPTHCAPDEHTGVELGRQEKA